MKNNGQFTLGIEGGGTKTTWALIDGSGKVIREGKAAAGNIQHLTHAQVESLLRSIRSGGATEVHAIGGAFAGCHLPREQNLVIGLAKKIWPGATRIEIGEDTRSALAGAHGDKDGIIVIAGTGSNVFGRKGNLYLKTCGWGYLFSDFGSAYHVARLGLEVVFHRYDESGHVGLLAQEYLRISNQNNLNELVPWTLEHATKTEIASLAPCVFNAAAAGDPDARQVLRDSLDLLARRVGWCSKRLQLTKPPVGLVGGLFEKQPSYVRLFRTLVAKYAPGSTVFLSNVPGAIGAAAMVRSGMIAPAVVTAPTISEDLGGALTEQRNPRSRKLDKLPVARLVRLFINEERHVENALRDQEKNITRAATIVATALAKKGRLFYVGAGTSGRLGVVDASEMPPTFGLNPEIIQGVIAGGSEAMFRSQEGAEDDPAAGALAVSQRGVQRGDVVCGIAASGRTPFVLGALAEARKRGAKIMLLSCNPERAHVPGLAVEIDLPTGPELVTGSTRLKAGTATKLVLNMLSTIAMIRTGRVVDNLMVAVQATNAKLRDRARRLVMTITGVSSEAAIKKLERANWNVRLAIKK